jgi:hypothetical protein
MSELKIYVPTFYGHAKAQEIEDGKQEEFDEPEVPILARPSAGLRIVLGSNDFFDNDAPDIQIERRPNGWAIFLHPAGDGDPSGYIYFIDDGRSFVVPERPGGSTPLIEQADYRVAQALVDNLHPQTS